MQTLTNNHVQVDDSEENRFGMISLHSCGDLTPNILKIFSQNKAHLKFLVAFGCCYHKMQTCGPNEECFKNFPFSKTLRNVFENSFLDFKLTKYALRAGSQENVLV